MLRHAPTRLQPPEAARPRPDLTERRLVLLPGRYSRSRQRVGLDVQLLGRQVQQGTSAGWRVQHGLRLEQSLGSSFESTHHGSRIRSILVRFRCDGGRGERAKRKERAQSHRSPRWYLWKAAHLQHGWWFDAQWSRGRGEQCGPHHSSRVVCPTASVYEERTERRCAVRVTQASHCCAQEGARGTQRPPDSNDALGGSQSTQHIRAVVR